MPQPDYLLLLLLSDGIDNPVIGGVVESSIMQRLRKATPNDEHRQQQ
jgi:hypothetical protein